MDLSRFITTKYWLDPSPSTDIHNLKIWLILFGMFALIGGLTLVNRFLYLKLRRKVGTFMLTTGLLALMLISFRFEGAYLLSSRLLFLVLLLTALVWFTYIMIYLVKGYPAELAEIAHYKKFHSYLPKKKVKHRS
jgi:hypothetical protein